MKLSSRPLNPLYDKKIVCLCCEKEFTSKQVRSSTTRVIKQDRDYCTYYSGENPLFYDAFVCPHCGFAFTQSFSKLTPRKKEIIEKEYFEKLPFVPDLCQKREIHHALQAYKWTAYTSYLVKEDPIITGNLFLRIAWLYRYQEKTEQEKRYLEIALRFYEKAYAKGNSEDIMNEHKLLFLLGDLYTRLDDYHKASKVFSMLLADQSVPPNIRQRAAESWNYYKELHNKKIKIK